MILDDFLPSFFHHQFYRHLCKIWKTFFLHLKYNAGNITIFYEDTHQTYAVLLEQVSSYANIIF